MKNRDSDNRFEEIYRQGGKMGLEGCKIVVDKETGVQYLLSWVGQAGGMTQLIDKDGNPLIVL